MNKMKNAYCHSQFVKSLFLIFLALSLLFATSSAVFAASEETTQEQNAYTVNEAFLYALAPDHLLPFAFDGYNPHPWIEIDISNCVAGQLYVYNELTDSVICVVNETVSTFAATKDNLFYVTDGGTISAVDYSGVSGGVLYQSEQGEITDIEAFGNLLYFIEGGQHAVIFNTQDLQAQTVTSQDVIFSLYMFDFDKIIWYDAQGNANYLNMSTQVNTAMANEYAVNCLINSVDASAEQQASTVSTYSTTSTSYNNVTFPLPEYPANEGEYGERPEAISSFDTSYANSRQCNGFAKYAHDRFWHLYDEDRTITDWLSDNALEADYSGASSKDMSCIKYDPKADTELTQFKKTASLVEKFFRGLNKGAFIRYVNYLDETPYNGTHSIVFAGLTEDGDGIYAYEANMDKNNGVGYQKYRFAYIAEKYATVLYYVDHSLSSTGVSHSSTYHRIECKRCDAYLLRSHNKKTSYSTTEHFQSCTGCNWTSSGAHKITGTICLACGYTTSGNVIMGNNETDVLKVPEDIPDGLESK